MTTTNLETLLSVFIFVFTCGMVLSWGWKFGMWIDNRAAKMAQTHPILCYLIGVVLVLIAMWRMS